MTKEEAKKMGATHFFQNEFNTSYWFYSSDVGMWFVWCKHWSYWTSRVFIERIEDLKPL